MTPVPHRSSVRLSPRRRGLSQLVGRLPLAVVTGTLLGGALLLGVPASAEATPHPPSQASPVAAAEAAVPPAPPCPPVIPACMGADVAGEVLDGIGDQAGDVVGGAVSSGLEGMADDAVRGAGEIMRETLTWWVKWDTPDPSAPDSTTRWLQARLAWITSFVAVLGVVVGGVSIAWMRARGLEDLTSGMGRFIVGWWMLTPAIGLLVAGGDQFSVWVLDQVPDDKTGQMVGGLAAWSQATTHSQILVLVVALVATVASLVQFAMTLLRDALLIVVSSLIGVAAAMAMFKWGRAMFDRTLAWVFALVCFKPVAAVIYAAALVQLGKGGDSLKDAISGVLLIVCAIVAFPALMRVAAPVANMVNPSGGGGLLTSSAAAAGARVAPGATGSPAPNYSGGSGNGGSVSMTASTVNGVKTNHGPTGATRSPATAQSGPAAGAGAGSAGASAAGTAGGAAGGATAAGAAGGPVGMAAVAATEAARQGARKVSGAVDGAGGSSGPSGAIDRRPGGQ